VIDPAPRTSVGLGYFDAHGTIPVMGTSIPIHELSPDEYHRHLCAPVPRIIHLVLLLALRDRATDVNFEPFSDRYRLTYVVDGVAYDMVPPPLHLASAFSQVFKVIAELDFCNSRTPQVGMMRLVVGEGVAEVLVSICPTEHGEKIHLSIESNSISREEIHEQLAIINKMPTQVRIG
jgi:type II secretory ATPase GspE/PulE/Tfp pilus assembly ATPase PilB-like protein